VNLQAVTTAAPSLPPWSEHVGVCVCWWQEGVCNPLLLCDLHEAGCSLSVLGPCSSGNSRRHLPFQDQGRGSLLDRE
jgi:hypothetical protein